MTLAVSSGQKERPSLCRQCTFHRDFPAPTPTAAFADKASLSHYSYNDTHFKDKEPEEWLGVPNPLWG